MKKVMIWMVAMVATLAIGRVAAGHPPNAIDLTYDLKAQELLVLVQHPVNDPNDHFIQEVVVTKNGTEVARKTFTMQSSKRDQTMPPFKFQAAPGDTIEVTATCNKFGSDREKLTVSETPQKPPRG